MQWENVRQDFVRDGSLRDIYITPATLDDWRTVYSFLREQAEVGFFLDGVLREPPKTVDEIFLAAFSFRPRLHFRIKNILAVVHFFSPDEVECDIDPRQITAQPDLDELLDFIRQLGSKVGKRVIITPENLREAPFISYDPQTKEFQHHT